MSSDVERLRRDFSLSEVAQRFGVKLQKNGREFIGCCPFHEEDTPSFTIFQGRDGVQRMHCFGCEEAKGDVIDFVQKIKNVDFQEAKRILGGGSAGPNVPRQKVEPRDIYAGIVPLDPPEEIEPGRKVRLYNPKRAGTETEWGAFVPSMIFPYRRSDGSLFGYVLRHDYRDGAKLKKETPMVMWVRLPDGRETWCRFPFPTPRPLYGLDALGDARQVIVVEGEKCRDALMRATGRTVMSWPGGLNGIEHADWSPLAGRNVVDWPDADGPGHKAADRIGAVLREFAGTTYRVLDVMGSAG